MIYIITINNIIIILLYIIYNTFYNIYSILKISFYLYTFYINNVELIMAIPYIVNIKIRKIIFPQCLEIRSSMKILSSKYFILTFKIYSKYENYMDIYLIMQYILI